MSDETRIYDVMREIEAVFDTPAFQGYRVGVTVNDTLVYLLNGHFENGPVDFCRYLAKCCLLFRARQGARAARPEADKGKLLFTWIHERHELRELVLPLVAQLGPDRSLVVGGAPSMAAALPPGTGFLWAGEIAGFNRRRWALSSLKGLVSWLPRLALVLWRGGISLNNLTFLCYAALSQTQRLLACERLLAELEPAAVVTEFDRNEFCSCLVLAANRRGIPTMTMVHGALNPYPAYGMYPVIAGTVFCWGELQRQQLLDCGVEPDKLVITGCQRLSRELAANRGAVREGLGIARESTVAVLATNPIRMDQRLKLARSFCEGVAGSPGTVGVIRLHPAERVEEYREVADCYPEVRLIPNRELSVDQSLALADVVVCHNTGYGSDALLKGCPTVVLDTIDLPLLNARELVEKAGCPRARSAQELSRLIGETASWPSLPATAESYVASLCVAFGADAVENIIATIKV